MNQDQMILARSRMWTPELDKLLRKWKKQLGKREAGHLNLARKYERRHYMFGIPATVLIAIVTCGILATFQSCDPCEKQPSAKCRADQWIRLVIGIIGLISVALTAFVTFINYQESAEKHKTAADDFGSMFRAIDTMLLVPGPVRGDPIATLQTLRSQYDDLVRRSPTLPKKYDADLTYELIGRGKINLPKPPTPDDINLSGRSPTMSRQTIIDLKSLMNESGEFPNLDNSFSEEDINQIVAAENDHDTSDEEVCITFDLDSTPSYNATTAAYFAAGMSSRQNQQIQNSLLEGLNFELQRLGNHYERPKNKDPKIENDEKIENEKTTEEEEEG